MNQTKRMVSLKWNKKIRSQGGRGESGCLQGRVEVDRHLGIISSKRWRREFATSIEIIKLRQIINGQTRETKGRAMQGKALISTFHCPNIVELKADDTGKGAALMYVTWEPIAWAKIWVVLIPHRWIGGLSAMNLAWTRSLWLRPVCHKFQARVDPEVAASAPEAPFSVWAAYHTRAISFLRGIPPCFKTTGVVAIG